MTQPVGDAAARQFRMEQEAEYGQFVATSDIYVGTALAYREGDPVPASNVERHGYDKNGLVAKTGIKAATSAKSEGK
ncbi:hypothetical protein [Actinoplanes regularis]|uniref:hypothetical protein n=1 Tax=Actinoplanes regularis TaxID=52697 RepID=UPI0024A0D975|nr:hypothetical protein [Actinoplanes regularis]GLW32274.1 hypothetical protein Areg01_52130 [Actinoplanes regularis]